MKTKISNAEFLIKLLENNDNIQTLLHDYELDEETIEMIYQKDNHYLYDITSYHQPISINFIEKYKDNFDGIIWKRLASQNCNVKFFNKFSSYFGSNVWDYIGRYKKNIPEILIDSYFNQFNHYMKYVINNNTLSINFFYKHIKKLNYETKKYFMKNYNVDDMKFIEKNFLALKNCMFKYEQYANKDLILTHLDEFDTFIFDDIFNLDLVFSEAELNEIIKYKHHFSIETIKNILIRNKLKESQIEELINDKNSYIIIDYICNYQNISEDFIDRYSKYLSRTTKFSFIMKHNKLSENFIKKYFIHFDFKKLIEYQKHISDDLILELMDNYHEFEPLRKYLSPHLYKAFKEEYLQTIKMKQNC